MKLQAFINYHNHSDAMEELQQSQALQAIRVIRSKLIEADDLQTYDEFIDVLKNHRNRKIHESTVVVTIQNLVQKHPDLLPVIEPFIPAAYKAAAKALPADIQAGVNFVAGLMDRFDAAHCRKIFNCISSFSRKESSVPEVRDKVLKLLGSHKDLAEEFVSFLPEYSGNIVVLGSSRKRRNSSSNSDEDLGNHERRKRRCVGGRKPDPRTEDFDMEDSLGLVDVQISSMESTYEKAEGLKWVLLADTEVRLEEHFSQINLACIRQLHKGFLKSEGENLRSVAVSDLMVRLERKMESLRKRKAELEEKWRKIRQSRTMIR